MNAFDSVAKGGGALVKLLAGVCLLLIFSLKSTASDSQNAEVGIVNGSPIVANSFPALTALLSGRGATIRLNGQIEIDGFFFGHGLNSAFAGPLVDCGDALTPCTDADEKVCLIHTDLQQQPHSPAAQLANCAIGGGIGALFLSVNGEHSRTDLFDGVPTIPAVFIKGLLLESALVHSIDTPLTQSAIQASIQASTEATNTVSLSVTDMHVEVAKRVAETILCGAVYLGDRWVLTVAHCVSETTQDGTRQILPWEVTATVDAYDLTADTHLTRSVDEIHLFNSPVAGNGSDIALLKLAQAPLLERVFAPVETSTASDPGGLIRIAESASINASTVQFEQGLVLGWGSTKVREPDEAVNNANTTSRVPMAAMVTLTPVAQCSALWQDYLHGNGISAEGFQIDDRHLCAHEPSYQRDTCQGDSGGPLLIDVEGQWQLAGLTSFGLGCGSVTGVPAVYTKVSKYIDWIKSITGIDMGTPGDVDPGFVTTPADTVNSPVATSGGGSTGVSLLLSLLVLCFQVGVRLSYRPA